jgi:hypothetical protein
MFFNPLNKIINTNFPFHVFEQSIMGDDDDDDEDNDDDNDDDDDE